MARYAFVLGANGPDGVDRLNYAVSDAQRFSTVLALPEYGYEVHWPTCTHDPYEIKREMDKLATSCKPDDSIIFFFSGHGKLLHGALMLVLDGTAADDVKTYLPVSRITEARDWCPAQHRLIILDCCHAGAALGGKGPLDISELGIESKTEIMILASKKFEIAREFDHLKGSFLTSEICEFLQQERRGVVALRHVMDHLHNAAIKHNESNVAKQPLVPIPFLNGNREGEFFFTIRLIARKLSWIPTSLKLQGNTLTWIGEAGQQEATTHPATLAGYRLVAVGQPREPWPVVWSHPTATGREAPSSAVITCFSRRRHRQWEYHFDGDSPFREQSTFNFHVSDIQLFLVNNEWRWFILFYDHPYFSSAVVVLDEKGMELRRLWHPGHLLRIIQLQNDKFAVTGFNNVRNLPGIPNPEVTHPHPPSVFSVRFDQISGVAFRQPMEQLFEWYYVFPKVEVKIQKFECRRGRAYLEIEQGRFFLIGPSGELERTGNLEEKQPPAEVNPVLLFPRQTQADTSHH